MKRDRAEDIGNAGLAIMMIGLMAFAICVMLEIFSWETEVQEHVTTARDCQGAPEIVYELEQADNLLSGSIPELTLLIENYRALENEEQAYSYHEAIFAIHEELDTIVLPRSIFFYISIIGISIMGIGMFTFVGCQVYKTSKGEI